MNRLKSKAKRVLRPFSPLTIKLENQLNAFNRKIGARPPYCPDVSGIGNVEDIREATLQYARDLRVTDGARLSGYRFAYSTQKPLLYCTLSVLLLKHLYGDKDGTAEELENVLSFQSPDGLFRDPVIACRAAEEEEWWGWRHLTLHALMTLALYGVRVPFRLGCLDKFNDETYLRSYLESLDWGARAAWTSNELQNLGVMLQYARDYQNDQTAQSVLDIIYEEIQAKQDPETGLHGDRFDTSEALSLGVQASYHFWLLFIYERRPIPHLERIVSSTLKTQNLRGGFSTQWNSSACEDIDSIDMLVRFGKAGRFDCEVRDSLQRAASSILTNLNGDGSWVFRRNKAVVLPHPEMCSHANEGNLFYTWFRTLGLAYCLIGLDKACPEALRYEWQLAWAPGLQLKVM